MDYYAPLNNPATEAMPRPPYINGNAAAAIKGSFPPAESAEHPMREILAVIEAAGIVPSRDDLTQLLQAIQILIANQTGTVVGGGGSSGPVVYNNKQVFLYTGADQNLVVPAAATMLKFKIWGAAGGIWFGDPNGAAGGFTLAEFNLTDGPIAPGAALKIMVGQGGKGKGIDYSAGSQSTGGTYGFGGASIAANSNGAWPGGGLSGIFSGNGAISAGQAAARGLAIAGGGGGSVYRSRPGQPHANGGYGNGVNGGGQASMQGQAATVADTAGGGGGYIGGSAAALPYINPDGGEPANGGGKGGSGFVHADAVASQILATTFGASPPLPYDPDYTAGTGVATLTGHGLVVAEWYIPA